MALVMDKKPVGKGPIISKKNIIRMVVLVVFVAAIFGAWTYFKKKNNTANVSSSLKGDLSSSEAGAIPPPTEIAKKETAAKMAVVEAENKFKQDLGECLGRFKNLEDMKTENVMNLKEDMVGINIMGTRDYYVCLAVKNDDSKYCDALKTDTDAFAFCQNEFLQVTGMMFPALKSNSCDQQVIDVCKRTGDSESDNCEAVCQGLYLGNVDQCNKIGDKSPLKSACLAINKKDIGLCSTLKDVDDENICEEEYYFITAAKENNPSLLDKIENAGERSVVKLYFDKNYKCEKILEGFGDNACNKKYNFDYLQEQEKAAGASQPDNQPK